MAKFCIKCGEFKGSIRTCYICSNAVCPDCSVRFKLCKDCFIEKKSIEVFEDYFNEKKVNYTNINVS